MAAPAPVHDPVPDIVPEAVAAPRSRIVHNLVHLAGGQAAATLAALVWLYFVPRAIGARGMGEIAIATSITGLLGTLLNPAIGTLLTRDIARRPERTGSLVGAGILIRFVGLLPAVAFLAVYTRVMHVGQEEAVLIWLAGASTLVASTSGIIQAAFSGLEQMQYIAYGNALGNALVRLAGIAIVLVGLGVVAIMQANLALTLLVLLLNVLWMRGHFRVTLRPDPGELRRVLVGSLSLWVGSVVFTTYLWIDTVILSALAPVEVVGWYNTPTQIFAALLMVPGVIGAAWFPRFARAAGEGARRLREVARPAVQLVVILSVPMSAGLAAVAPSLVWTLYGESFHGAVWVLMILAITMVPTFFNMVCFQMLLASDRQMAWIRVVVVATAINVVLNVALTAWFQARFHNGAVGSALSLLITEVMEAGCAVYLLPGVLDGPLLRRLARTVLAAGLMAGLVLITGHLTGGRLGLVAQLVVGLLSFVPLCLLLRVPGEAEMRLVHAAWSRVRRPVAA